MAHLAGEAVGGEWVVLTVGLPEARLNGLLDSYRSDRMQRVSLEGHAMGHTASYFYEDRPLILFGNEDVLVGISGIAIHEPQAGSSEAKADEEEDAIDALDSEAGRPVDGRGRGGRAATRGWTILAITAAVCVLLTLLGSSSISVLAVAVLGGAGALVTTLTT